MSIERLHAVAFGGRFGWRVSDGFFTIDQLRRGAPNIEGVDDHWPRAFADHADFYSFADGRPAAVVGHLYALVPAEIRAWARSCGLQVAFPAYTSWYYPGRTTLVVYWSARP